MTSSEKVKVAVKLVLIGSLAVELIDKVGLVDVVRGANHAVALENLAEILGLVPRAALGGAEGKVVVLVRLLLGWWTRAKR